jgi:hypothetical protein
MTADADTDPLDFTRSIRMSARSAYALLDNDGSNSFASAWDQAMMMGVNALRDLLTPCATRT